MKSRQSLDDLETLSRQQLADLARQHGLADWKSLTKEQLVKALSRKIKKSPTTPLAPKTTLKSKNAREASKAAPKPVAKLARPAKASSPATGKTPAANGLSAKPKAPPAKAEIKPQSRFSPASPPPQPTAIKDLSATNPHGTPAVKDRILLMVPDPFWLHASWELTAQSVQRAEAALKQDWHGAKPIIRLFDVTSQDTTSTSETPIRDIVIHGGCNNWYIDVPQPPRSYRADIGYLSKRGEFYVLARSNVVTPPVAGSSEAIDEAWSDYDGPKRGERVLAMSSGFENSEGDPELKKYLEEKLKRPMGLPKDAAFGSGAMAPHKKSFFFDLDAKLIVYGKTDPMAHVTLQNEPVRLAPDGSFVMWFGLPDSRQIIPAVATSADGTEERTIVLAIERNTKHLDPMIHDQLGEA